MFKNRKGFTLIELIIVMAIIAILVLLAAPKFMDYVENAKITQIKNDIKVVENVVQAEIAKNVANDEPITVLGEAGTGQAYDKNASKLEKGEDLPSDAKIIKDAEILKTSKLSGKNDGKFLYSEEKGEAYYQDSKVNK